MNFITIRLFFGRRDTQMVIYDSLAETGLQFLARWYLKHHPELLKTSTKPPIPRGGDIVTVNTIRQALLVVFSITWFDSWTYLFCDSRTQLNSCK